MDIPSGSPKAYVQVLLFDMAYNYVGKLYAIGQCDCYAVVPANADQSFQKISLNVEVPRDGYAYIYTANESNKDIDVWFDNLGVMHLGIDAVQQSDYYPFGSILARTSYGEGSYRFGYQGQFAQEDQETGWNQFEARNYDPILGRWLSTDPARQFWSPYLGMGNNPINSIDPDGEFSWLGAMLYKLKYGGDIVKSDDGYIVNDYRVDQDGVFIGNGTADSWKGKLNVKTQHTLGFQFGTRLGVLGYDANFYSRVLDEKSYDVFGSEVTYYDGEYLYGPDGEKIYVGKKYATKIGVDMGLRGIEHTMEVVETSQNGVINTTMESHRKNHFFRLVKDENIDTGEVEEYYEIDFGMRLLLGVDVEISLKK